MTFLYNPALYTREQILEQLIVREELLAALVEDLRRALRPGSGPQHHLLTGQRGMGKTTMLHRVAAEVDRDPELSRNWIPLLFAEEQYAVHSLDHFWRNCAESFLNALEARGVGESELTRMERELAGRVETGHAESLLSSWSERSGLRLLILLDNAELVLDRCLKDDWALRERLSHDRRLCMIGASVANPTVTGDYSAAFYGFFRPHRLRGLNDADAERLLRALAGRDGKQAVLARLDRDPGALKSLRTLTGGNIRTLVLLYDLLAEEATRPIRSHLDRLLDALTPLYKHRFESISPQAQRVLHHLAMRWEPGSAAEVADAAELPVNVVSAVLERLREEGLVEETSIPPNSRKGYLISERFFNIWYLMRQGRSLRKKLLWFVDFLQAFFSKSEIQQQYEDHVRSGPPAVDSERVHWSETTAALAQAHGSPHLERDAAFEIARGLAEASRALRREMESILGNDPELATLVDRMAMHRRVKQAIAELRHSRPERVSADFEDSLLGCVSLKLEEKAALAERLSSISESQIESLHTRLAGEAEFLVSSFGSGPAGLLRQALIKGWISDINDEAGAREAPDAGARQVLPDVVLAIRLGCKLEAELNSEDGPSERLDWWHSAWPFWLAHAVKRLADAGATPDSDRSDAWSQLGDWLADSSDRRPLAERAYRRAIELNSDNFDAHFGLGYLLQEHLGRWTEAEVSYRQAAALKPDNAWPWNNLGNLLKNHLARFDEAEDAYRTAIQIDPTYAYPWNGLGNLLANHLARFDEAEAAYRTANQIDPKFANAWNGLGNLLQDHFARFDEAEAAFRTAIQIDPRIAFPWNNLGNLLQDHLGRFDEAEAAFRCALELHPAFVTAMGNLAELCVIQGRDPVDARQQLARAREAMPEVAYTHQVVAWLELREARPWDAGSAAARAVELDRQARVEYRHTLACALALQGRMEEAEEALRGRLDAFDADRLARGWPNLLTTYVVSLRWADPEIAAARATALIEMQQRTGLADRWWPLLVALKAVEERTEDPITRTAPEVREAARGILAKLRPDGLGPPPEKRRRKKATSGPAR